MWGENEDSFKSVTRVNVRPARNVRVDLTLLVMGDSVLGSDSRRLLLSRLTFSLRCTY